MNNLGHWVSNELPWVAVLHICCYSSLLEELNVSSVTPLEKDSWKLAPHFLWTLPPCAFSLCWFCCVIFLLWYILAMSTTVCWVQESWHITEPGRVLGTLIQKSIFTRKREHKSESRFCWQWVLKDRSSSLDVHLCGWWDVCVFWHSGVNSGLGIQIWALSAFG